MKFFKIFNCPRCKLILYCSNTQKIKKCPKCQKNIILNRTNVLKTTNSVQDAILITQNLKLPPELRKKIIYPKISSQIKGKKEKFIDFIQTIQKNDTIHQIDEVDFLKKAEEVGFSKDWVLMQLAELEKLSLLIRPQKGYMQFLL